MVETDVLNSVDPSNRKKSFVENAGTHYIMLTLGGASITGW